MDDNQVNQTNPDPVPTQNNFNPKLIGGIFIVVIVVMGGFLLSRSQSPRVATTENVQMQEPVVTIMADQNTSQEIQNENLLGVESETTTIQVEGGSFYFEPNEIRVKQGQSVRIVLTNAGGMHDFVIDELNVKTKTLQSGESTEVEFVADKPGTYEFYCSIGNHRAMGMKGNLIIE